MRKNNIKPSQLSQKVVTPQSQSNPKLQQSAITIHLQSKLEQLNLENEQQEKLQTRLTKRKEEILQAIRSKQLIPPTKQRPISPILKKDQINIELTQQINENLRNQRLKEAQRLKQQLKEKLETVHSSIQVLEGWEVIKEKEKVQEERITKLKAVREKYFNKEGIEQENKENAKAAAFAKSLAQQQKQRRQMYKQYMKETQRKLAEKQANLAKKKQKEQKKMREHKLEKLKENLQGLMVRQEERKIQIEKDKEQFRLFNQQKPLYQNIEEKYQTEILMPELERRKQELQKRRDFYGSIRSSDIFQHSRKYQTTILELNQQKERNRKERELDLKVLRLNTKYKSVKLKDLIEKEKQQREEENAQMKQRVELLQKRNRYGELVKTMYAPLPSQNKKTELEKLNEAIFTKPREVRLHESKKEAKD